MNQLAILGSRRRPDLRFEIGMVVLSVAVGVLLGGVVLLNLSLSWLVMTAGMVGLAAMLVITRQPVRVMLFALAALMPLGIGKPILSNDILRLAVSSVAIEPADLLALTLLALCLARSATDQTYRFRLAPATTIPALLWIGASVLSLMNARDFEAATIELFTLAKLLLLLLAVANSIRGAQDAVWLVAGFMLALGFEASLGIYQGLTGNYLGLSFLGEGTEVLKQNLDYNLFNRCQGTVCHPNGLSMYLNTVIPFALAILFTGVRKQIKLVAAGLVCLGTVAMVLTLSRGGWIGFLGMGAVVFILGTKRHHIPARAGAAIACAVIVVAAALSFTGPNIVTERLTANDYRSASSRIVMAQGALNMIQAYPVTGVGVNNYTLYMRTFDPATFLEEHGLYVVHDAYLLVTAETGILGLAAFVLFLLSIMLQSYKIKRGAADDQLWIIGVGVLAGFLAVSVHNTADFAMIGCPRVLAQMWFLAGITAGFGYLSRREFEGDIG